MTDKQSSSTDGPLEAEESPPRPARRKVSRRRDGSNVSRSTSHNSVSGGGCTSDSGDDSTQDFGALPSLTFCLYGMEVDELSNTEEENAATCPTAPHHVVHVKYLRKLASRGIPDEGSHRAVVWRLLLGYLPPETEAWQARLTEARHFYKTCTADLFADTWDTQHGDALRWRPRRPRRGPIASRSHDDDNNDDHNSDNDNNHNHEEVDDENNSQESSLEDVDVPPPALKPEEEEEPSLARPDPVAPEIPETVMEAWKARGKDEHLLLNLMKSYNALRIQEHAKGRKPVAETTNSGEEPQGAASPTAADDDDDPWARAAQDFVDSAVLLDEVRKDVFRTHPDLAFFLDPLDDLGRRRYYALERILFVWATYNKGVRYVQGMNEIVGAIYYVMAKDWKQEWAAEAEADTYYLFSTLLAEMRDVFISDMDDADTGIQGRLAHMQTLLQLHDPEVKEHLDEVGVDVSYYAVRWWTCLASREFLLPDTIRLWDSLFASTHKDNFMRYVCVTMVLTIRDRLLKGDFSTCMKLLQGYPSTQMDHLIESSRALWIYETQINLAIHKGGYTRHMALQTIKPPPALIMAFGFRKGIAPKTRGEILEEAGEKAAERLRDATTMVSTSARTYLGKANGLFNKYMQQRKETSSDSEYDKSQTNGRTSTGSSDGEEVIKFSEDKLKTFEDDMYLAEFATDSS
eukprot:scaffold1323_cov160-Amphora_coffeaeformis.AAC.22